MRLFVVTYSLVEDMGERRVPYRDAHFEYLEQSKAGGKLFLAGPCKDPYGAAIFMLDMNTRGEAMAWAAGDPYVQAGLVTGVDVKELAVAVSRWTETRRP